MVCLYQERCSAGQSRNWRNMLPRWRLPATRRLSGSRPRAAAGRCASLDGKKQYRASSEPQKNSKKHVVLINPQNIEKDTGAGAGGGLDPKHSKSRVLGSDQKHGKTCVPSRCARNVTCKRRCALLARAAGVIIGIKEVSAYITASSPSALRRFEAWWGWWGGGVPD